MRDDNRFQRIQSLILILGTISFACLTILTIYLHDHCSIISYIANKG